MRFGVIHSNQTGGVLCLKEHLEGVFVPVQTHPSAHGAALLEIASHPKTTPNSNHAHVPHDSTYRSARFLTNSRPP
jgi:hypothetical protein